MRHRTARHLLRRLQDRNHCAQTCIQHLQRVLSGVDEEIDDIPLPYHVLTVMDRLLEDISVAEDDSQTLNVPLGDTQVEESRRRRPAQSSMCLPHQDVNYWASNRVGAAVDRLRQKLDAMVMEGEVDDRHNIMRIVTQELARQVNARAGRLRLLLMLLSDLLPQPRQNSTPTSSASLVAFDVFREILNELDSLDVLLHSPYTSYLDFEWVSSAVGNLGPFAIDVMSFLENAGPLDSLSSLEPREVNDSYPYATDAMYGERSSTATPRGSSSATRTVPQEVERAGVAGGAARLPESTANRKRASRTRV